VFSGTAGCRGALLRVVYEGQRIKPTEGPSSFLIYFAIMKFEYQSQGEAVAVTYGQS
jgi:hypothetical protein